MSRKIACVIIPNGFACENRGYRAGYNHLIYYTFQEMTFAEAFSYRLDYSILNEMNETSHSKDQQLLFAKNSVWESQPSTG
jgi:hypothetical protein